MTKLERIIVASKPVIFLKRKSKELIIPGFEGIPLYDVLQFFFTQIKRFGLNERAAAISFNVIMAIPATCIFLFSVVPYLPVSDLFKTEILALTKDLSPNQNTYKLVESFLNDFLKKSRSGLLSFGILMVLYYASNAMMGIIHTFDKSISEAKTHFIHQRWRAIKLTVFLMILVICCVLFLIGHDALEKILRHYFHLNKARLDWWESSRWLVIVVLIFMGISIIYKYAPSVNKTGHVTLPSPTDKLEGGHAVMAVGYDDKNQWFIIRNSWGTSWGIKGYFTLPYAYVTENSLADDFWTIRLVE